MSLLDFLLGKPIPTSGERGEQVDISRGVSIFGLDALSSAAYGPEAALSLLIPLGLAGVRYIVPISVCIIALLFIVFFSYRQTIAAYPTGGGSYTVARLNLGAFAGLLAAAALMTDYILTAAVGISAGVGALVSAAPSLQPHTLSLCLGILAVLVLMNLRGMKDAGSAFVIPTYLFAGTLLITIVWGAVRALLAGGHPAPAAVLPAAPPAMRMVGAWLLLKAFASGCTALTGVEAVSNGVRAFREPAVKNAQRTLTVIIVLLALLLAGIAFLARAYGIAATDPDQAGYQSVLSLLVGAVFGRGWFYFLTMASVLTVLCLSANTAFADFPRLCRAMAQNNYLPHSLGFRGRRLVYTQGILVLGILAGGLLLLFGGVTDRLIPLYAIGAFLAFTLSQWGMVQHWRKNPGPHARKSALVNGLGGFVTGITVLVVLVAKFKTGAWITILFIPLAIGFFLWVRRHYHAVLMEISSREAAHPASLALRPLAILPVDTWSSVARHGVEFASRLSGEIIGVHVDPEGQCELLKEDWERYVAAPFRQAGAAPPELVVLPSPYRFVVTPLVEYIVKLAEEHPQRRIVVIITEMVEMHWYEYFLHNQRGRLLEFLLVARGNERIFTVMAPYYLGAGLTHAGKRD
jgi:amino acid transporter